MAGNGRITLSAENEIKLALAFFFSILLAADLLSIYSLVQARRSLADEQRLSLSVVIAELSHSLSMTGPSSLQSEAELGDRLRTLGIRGGAAVYAPDGSMLHYAWTPEKASQPELLPSRLDDSARQVSLQDHPRVVEKEGARFLTATKAIQTSSGVTNGYLVLAVLRDTGRLLSDQLITAFQIAIVFLSLPFIIYFSRWLTMPYREIAQVVEENGIQLPAGSDLSQRRSLTDAFRDIVQQLRLKERELERVNLVERRRAQSFETLSGRIVESIPSGLVGFDREGRTIISNEQAHRVFQVQSIGPQSGDASSYESFFKGSDELVAMIKETLSAGRTFRYRELDATIGKGVRRTFGVSVSPIGRGYTDIQGALCLVSDVTEINELKERVRVREYLSSLGEMSAGIAHEFKNSLATIHGFAQLLQSRAYRTETSGEIAGSVIDETQHLTQMVTDFLNFARPQQVDFSDVDFAEIVTECKDDLAAAIESSRVTFTIEGPLPIIRGDATMLRHALLNLLRNAIEAIPEEAERRDVQLRTSAVVESDGTQWLEAEISDTGSGIEPEILSKIFVPFFTTKSKGHGIGLAIVQKIFSGHNGSIHVESTLGAGTTFRCRIPLASSQPGESTDAQTTQETDPVDLSVH